MIPIVSFGMYRDMYRIMTPVYRFTSSDYLWRCLKDDLFPNTDSNQSDCMESELVLKQRVSEVDFWQTMLK